MQDSDGIDDRCQNAFAYVVASTGLTLPPVPRDWAVMAILKIFRDDEWRDFRNAGRTTGAPVDQADGFIHFSTENQVHETVEKHFAGETSLWLVEVDEGALGDALKWEASRGGALFPHLYRELRLSEVSSQMAWDDWARANPAP